MASTSCFLHQTTARFGAAAASPRAAAPRAHQFACKAQKQQQGEAEAVVPRRAALALLAGAAAVAGVKVAPAAAAYGESGSRFVTTLLYL
jgi:photosystem II oxygen-evolving enhancer protein 2